MISHLKPGELTPKEQEIAVWVAKGLSNREIAELMYVAENSISHHITDIFRKKCLNNRVKLALWALKSGLVNLAECQFEEVN